MKLSSRVHPISQSVIAWLMDWCETWGGKYILYYLNCLREKLHNWEGRVHELEVCELPFIKSRPPAVLYCVSQTGLKSPYLQFLCSLCPFTWWNCGCPFRSAGSRVGLLRWEEGLSASAYSCSGSLITRFQLCSALRMTIWVQCPPNCLSS